MKVKACACCFAKFLLGQAAPGSGPSAGPSPRSDGAQGGKRAAHANFTGEMPEPKRQAAQWKVSDVLEYLKRLDLGHVCGKFVENGVDGRFLLELSEEDLVTDLGLTKLQARKVLSRLP
jgi:hypothetical protein